MNITKYEHACLVIEEQGRRMVLDPGDFATGLDKVTDVDVMVITHDHYDHLGEKQVAQVLEANPDVQVFAAKEVAAKLEGKAKSVTVAADGEQHEVGPFTFKFYGEEHAPIHDDMAGMMVHNVGIMVNGKLYYPGDSYFVPAEPVEVLAIPTSGPWFKTGEAIDFIKQVKPKLAFPIHDGHNSDAGNGLTGQLLEGTMKAWDGTYRPTNPGDTFDI
jgi:L-ascorbate metabolism protein UlaG (beta-lactamase superfamily)